MKLSIEAPSLNWEEAAKLAREYDSQGLLADTSKKEPLSIIGKYKYLLWKTKSSVYVALDS